MLTTKAVHAFNTVCLQAPLNNGETARSGQVRSGTKHCGPIPRGSHLTDLHGTVSMMCCHALRQCLGCRGQLCDSCQTGNKVHLPSSQLDKVASRHPVPDTLGQASHQGHVSEVFGSDLVRQSDGWAIEFPCCNATFFTLGPDLGCSMA